MEYQERNNFESSSELANKIFAITDQASSLLMKYYKQVLNVDYKKDEFDPVTIADREADSLIREQLHKEFPEDLILSEENEFVPADYSGRVWMVDPLDGTKDFLKGRTSFGINVGLLENGVPIFGYVAIPARNQFFYAEKDKGSFEKIGNSFKKLQVNTITNIEESRLVTRNPSSEIRPLEEKINKMPFKEQIPEGGMGVKFSLVASGQAEAHVNTNFKASKWDTLAPGIILTEAGGVITDLDGNQLDYTKPASAWERSFVIANNKITHQKIIESLK